MQKEFNFSIMPNKLDNSLDIDSDVFGKVKFYYYIRHINNVKFLRYKIDNCPGLYDVMYSEIEYNNITLHEYFRNVLKFLNLQINEVGDDENFIKDMSEEDIMLFDYLKGKRNDNKKT